MKKIYAILLAGLIITSCRKTEPVQPNNIQKILRDSLSSIDFSRLDFSRSVRSKIPGTNNALLRVAFKERDLFQDYILLQIDSKEKVLAGKILHIDGSITPGSKGGKASFNGNIQASSLKRDHQISSKVVDGFILSLHPSVLLLKGARMEPGCPDCTLEDVVVSTTIHNNTINYNTLLSLWWLFNYWPDNDYMYLENPWESSDGGGGGDGGGEGGIVTIDTEHPEIKEKIDVKKYIDCFGQIPDNGATCTISIETDIPVDGHPEIFFNWSDNSPGHAFIEFYKNGAGGVIVQNIGFYPDSQFKTLSGDDGPSKIIDNGGHEYNARYTISVTPAQLQKALNTMQVLSTHDYNIASYNCTDFALAVFNAAGGNLTIPQYQIPGYGIANGSNTPQGLYKKITDIALSGNSSAEVKGNKAYTSMSHGPCN
ncbi:MAG: hypothetical protein JWN76_427 [Chitinophagaceae bacterium]|nr:hypothetical protein [Chitinophagaceae bacterium]